MPGAPCPPATIAAVDVEVAAPGAVRRRRATTSTGPVEVVLLARGVLARCVGELVVAARRGNRRSVRGRRRDSATVNSLGTTVPRTPSVRPASISPHDAAADLDGLQAAAERLAECAFDEPLEPALEPLESHRSDANGAAIGASGPTALVRSPLTREWRNWQTRRIQVPVPARVWGFKSPLAHDVNGRRLLLTSLLTAGTGAMDPSRSSDSAACSPA